MIALTWTSLVIGLELFQKSVVEIPVSDGDLDEHGNDYLN
jgi:hypothetical protein